MKNKHHTDLRIIKTKNAIKNAFRQMVNEMDANDITVIELAKRAMIHRKTFYLHYTCIEDLFEDMIKEEMNEYIQTIDQLPIPMTMKDINHVFFSFVNQQDQFIERLICTPSYRTFCNKLFALTLKHNRERYNPYAHFDLAKQNIINNFLSTSTLDMYRQWVLDGKVIPIDELEDLCGNLLAHGVSSI